MSTLYILTTEEIKQMMEYKVMKKVLKLSLRFIQLQMENIESVLQKLGHAFFLPPSPPPQIDLS